MVAAVVHDVAKYSIKGRGREKAVVDLSVIENERKNGGEGE